MASQRRAHHPCLRALKTWALLVAAAVGLSGMYFLMPVRSASAAIINAPAVNDGRIGYLFSDVPGYPDLLWLGSQSIKADGTTEFCIQSLLPPVVASTPVISVENVPQASPLVKGLEMTPAQMAWLMKKYQKTGKKDDMAALSLLAHANFEIDSTPQLTARMALDATMAVVRRDAPHLESRAQEFVREARASHVKGYSSEAIIGENQRYGSYTGFYIEADSGTPISGITITATIKGPAVWDETGTSSITLVSAADRITKNWSATAEGDVSVVIQWVDTSGSLKSYNHGSQAQNTLVWEESTKSVTSTGRTWHVVYDFQPVGISHAPVYTDNGEVTDTFQAQALSDGGSENQAWLTQAQVGLGDSSDSPVPVVYTADLYQVKELALPTPQLEGEIPSSAQKVDSRKVVADGPGEVNASFSVKEPGWYVAVWRVEKKDQGEFSDAIRSDWSDGWAQSDETISYRYESTVDSSISIRSTKSGTYLVDDVWVQGLPEDHPEFTGGMRFQADFPEFTQKLLFFPDGEEVKDSNISAAHIVGSLTFPAKNGFYPSLGSTQFKVLEDESGRAKPGTYVFVTSFPGDSRVQPFSSSVEDTTEQYSIAPEPSLRTTLLYEKKKDPVPAGGMRTLVDKVCYSNVRVAPYTLTGTLMDKNTGTALQDKNGQNITAQTSLVPTAPFGCAQVEFHVDAGLLAGKTTVAFERMQAEGIDPIIHADLNDKNQTLEFTPPIQTTAIDTSDGDKILKPIKGAKIEDTVCPSTDLFVPGMNYTITASLKYPDGSSVKDKQGQEIAHTIEFSPSSARECAKVPLGFDASDMSGKTVVVFEDIHLDGHLIAVHHDVKDADQTVKFEHNLATTGSSLGLACACVGAMLMAGGGVWASSMRFKRRS